MTENLTRESLVLIAEAAVCTFGLGFPIHYALLNWKVVDRPNERSSHLSPTVRGGGIAVLLSFMIVGSFAVDATWRIALVAFAGLLLAIVSFIDDLRSLPQAMRLVVQMFAALVALYALCSRGMGALSTANVIGIGSIGFLWIIGFTNAFNFMDGINGIAGFQVFITGIGTALVGIAAGGALNHPAIALSLVLAGSGLGFLPHNFPHARMFLGDVGSAPIGFFLAVFAFWLSWDLGWWLLVAFGLLHANFVLDTSITLVRRIWNGERWFEPHREHFYQRLVRAGKSHPFVVGWEGLIQTIVLFLVLIAMKMGWPARIVIGGIVCVGWMVFFSYAEVRFRRRPIEVNAS